MNNSVETYDLAVIGSGPAGLAAAVKGAALGLEVVVFDEQPTPGGQIYRNVEKLAHSGGAVAKILGYDYLKGAIGIEKFRASGARFCASHTVLQIAPDGTIASLYNGSVRLTKARRVIIATGAMERPIPVPGWTLPGVMGAGAAQTLIKSASMIPIAKSVIVGSGPLVYLVAIQLLKAGRPPELILNTAKRPPFSVALLGLRSLFSSWRDFFKGLRWLLQLRAAKIQIIRSSEIAFEGDGRLESVTYSAKGKRHRIHTALALVHEGVVPNIQITSNLRCKHVWDKQQQAWKPEVDDWGTTSDELVAVAGDGGGILGADSAAVTGTIAAIESARYLGRLTSKDRDLMAKKMRRKLKAAQRFRRFLDALYTPTASVEIPADDTVVCRCEEVDARTLREYFASGVLDINQLKSISRCGMGPCQGRMCGATVLRMLASAKETSPEEIGHYRIRSPIRPLTISQLATLRTTEVPETLSAPPANLNPSW